MLYSDSAEQLIQKTRAKPNTASPHFQEILMFSLNKRDLVDAKLRVSIWNKDSISQNDFLGEAILSLYKEEVNGGVATWHRLQPEVCETMMKFYEIHTKIHDASLSGVIFSK